MTRLGHSHLFLSLVVVFFCSGVNIQLPPHSLVSLTKAAKAALEETLKVGIKEHRQK